MAQPSAVVMSEAAPRDLAAEFASECLDLNATGSIVSNPSMWAAWTKFCGQRNADPGTKKSLQAKLKNYAAYENNNNRPRYAGVKLNTATGLRLAVSN